MVKIKDHFRKNGILYFFYGIVLFSISLTVWLVFFSGKFDEILSWVGQFVENQEFYVYLFAFLVALAEGSLILALVPGSTTLILLGFFLGQGYLNIGIMLAVTISGAFFGNLLGYLLGYAFSGFIKRKKYDQHRYYLLGSRFVKENGGRSIFFAKFASGIKEVVPAITGALRMNFKKFTLYNFLGSIAWAIVWLSAGFFTGNLTKATGPVSRIIGALFLIFFFVMIFVSYKKMQKKFKI